MEENKATPTTTTKTPEPMMPKEERHLTSTKYYPATRKDHDRSHQVHHYCEHENVGMDTYTHTSRYVPAHSSNWLTRQLYKLRHPQEHARAEVEEAPEDHEGYVP